MREIVATKLAVFAAALAVADKPANAILWQEKPPLAFAETMGLIRPLIAALRTKGVSELELETCAERLRNLRGQLEASLDLVARGAFRCLINQGKTEEAKKVDIMAEELAAARPVALVEKGEIILETAEDLFIGTPSPAAKYFTHLQFDMADQLWQKFTVALGARPCARGKRKGLNTGILGEIRALEVLFATCDDLIRQFAIDSESGTQFVGDWFEARHLEHLSAAPPYPRVNVIPFVGAGDVRAV